jgi:hypothetical protein
MDRPRLIRGLRIAVSAVCGVLWLLLIVLWTRRYRDEIVALPQHLIYLTLSSMGC